LSIEFWGDILHFASIQFPNPKIRVVYDVNSNAAAEQRAKQFARAKKSRRERRNCTFIQYLEWDTSVQKIKVIPGCLWIIAGVFNSFISCFMEELR
jgi:hypothetical protein